MNAECRRFRESDLPALIAFFRECYGPETIFQDPEFIHWFFAGAPDGGIESLVAVSAAGAVVAHHGGMPGTLQLRGRPIPMVWASNAFTLPEWRGRGLGQQLAAMMADRYEVVGIIGFTSKTADFYHARGFEIFAKQRFHRFALALRASAHDVAALIGVDRAVAEKRFPLADPRRFSETPDVQPLSAAPPETFNAPTLTFGAAPVRNPAFLTRRFLRNPFIHYAGFFTGTPDRMTGYIVTRSERLFPTEHDALRIIDFRAEPQAVEPLLQAVMRQGIEDGASFIDFACVGRAYDSAFSDLGFTALHGDDAALLPQVTSPIEARPNLDYFGFFSRRHRNEIAVLTADELYLTRADSDRDRITRLSQRATA